MGGRLPLASPCHSLPLVSSRLGCPDFVPLAFRKSQPPTYTPEKKYEILSILAEITAQTRFLFPVVISISVMLATIPKCQNIDETIAYPLLTLCGLACCRVSTASNYWNFVPNSELSEKMFRFVPILTNLTNSVPNLTNSD